MNTEERQLAEMLHRVTPEPPRRVTVEDVAFRLASEAGRARGRYREPRVRRGLGAIRGRGWAPVLAAVSVFVVAGASAGVATVMSSHHGKAPARGGGPASASASASSSSPSAAPSSTGPPMSTGPASLPERVAGGMWGAELIDHQSFTQAWLAGSGNSLYAATGSFLDRIDPATGNILQTTPYSPPVPNRPVVMGNTVWVVWSYSGGNVVLRGYDARTLAQVASVLAPAIGRVSGTAQGVLTGAPDGHLYLAAGDTVAVLDPAAGQLIRRIYLSGGPASSVAVSPDGGTLYVGSTPSAPSGAFQLRAYALGAEGHTVQTGSSRMTAGDAGNLVATSGGVWGTAGAGMNEWAWFAPHGDLTRVVRVSQGPGAGLDSVPSFSGGAVWIGGSQRLACANPATGRVMASIAIPAGNGIAESFGGVTVTSTGRTYALYQNQAAHQSGVVTLTPPARC